MGKNWLIRTKSNHILGPVSKDKVLELYKNGSIKQDDEICSGNGYWFYIRESDLVDRFLICDGQQSFNPISEAKDVLTSSSVESHEPTRDDITMVGGIDLGKIKETSTVKVGAVTVTNKIDSDILHKKKLRIESVPKQSNPVPKQAKQNYFKYLGILVFLILVLVIYFRKSILKSFFHSEAYLREIPSLLITPAFAQNDSSEKKNLLKSEVLLDEVIFKPSISLDGFRVVSSFDNEKIDCQKLESHVFQLAVILYPPDLFNEKFLISIRNCMLKLDKKHPLKRWLASQSSPPKPDKVQQDKIDFLNEMLNSQFNLITDHNVKKKVIDLIAEVRGESNVEQLLKSYLYLMIGNITRSDNILKIIISQSPREFYKGYSANPSIYHKTTSENLEKVLRKFSRHPADRLTFYLFTTYVKSFLNDAELLELIDHITPDGMKEKIDLTYTFRMAPELVGFARLSMMSEKRRMKNLRMKKYSQEMQSYWVWPFLDVNPLISETMIERVKVLDKVDPLWSVYLMANEKLSDMYFSKGGEPVSRRRQFLRKHLLVNQDFMLTLYKLIEIGDIDDGLVNEAAQFMIHE